MSVFRFRLARVLRVRTIEEEAARHAWLAAEQAVRQAQELAAQTRAQLTGSLEETSRLQLAARIRPEEILQRHALEDALRRKLSADLRRASALRAQAERQRGAWEHARRERRSTAKLEERAHAAHRATQTRLENRQLDETSIERAARRHPPSSARTTP